MPHRLLQLPPKSFAAVVLSCAVFLVAATVAVSHAEHAFGSGALLRESVELGHDSARLHDALRQYHLAAARWLDSGGRPDLRAEVAERRQAVAEAIAASALGPSSPLMAEIDERTRAAEQAIRAGGTPTVEAQQWVDDSLEDTAMALEAAMSELNRTQLRAAEALVRHDERWLWFSGATALVGLLLASTLVLLHFRRHARAEGATQMRNELLERISDGFFALDRQFRFVHMNPMAEERMQVKLDQVHGKTVFEVWPILETHPVGDMYRQAMAASAARTQEIPWTALGRWFELRLYPSPEGLSIFFRDITEARQMRLALAESEARHRQIVQTAQEGIWIFNATGHVTFVNEKLCALLGYGRDELMGRHLFDFMDAEGQRIAAENLSRRALGLREQFDFKLRRKDGSVLWALIATSALPAGQADGGSTLAMITDITERRTAETERGLLLSRERALRSVAEASQDRYRVLANLVPHLVWTHRADGGVDFVNETYAQRTGRPPEQALGTGWQAVIHPEDLPGYLETWKASLVSGEPIEHRIRLRVADGSWHWHVGRAHAARDAEGRLLRWFGLAIDVELADEQASLGRTRPAA